MDNIASIQNSEQQEIYLPYDLKYIPDALQKRAKSELFEDEERRRDCLTLFRSMLTDDGNLQWLDDDLQLLAFLRARKFDVKRAFNLYQHNDAILKKYDEVYGNFNYEDVRKTLQENSFGFLPYRDKEGCVIAIFRVEKWNPHNNSAADILRAVSYGACHAMLYPASQIAGIKAIVDCSGCGLWKLPYVKPSYLWAFATALQNCFPARIKAIHVVNEVSLFAYVWPLIKHILSKKIRERFHFHGKHVKKLHKIFSPKILPSEFGGELPSFDNSTWAAKMAESSDYLNSTFARGYKKKEKQSAGT